MFQVRIFTVPGNWGLRGKWHCGFQVEMMLFCCFLNMLSAGFCEGSLMFSAKFRHFPR